MQGDKPLSIGDHRDPCFADWDGDGKLDLLVGDSARLRSLPEGMTREESEKGLAEWNKEMSELQKQFQKDQF